MKDVNLFSKQCQRGESMRKCGMRLSHFIERDKTKPNERCEPLLKAMPERRIYEKVRNEGITFHRKGQNKTE
jgi:hypothetical protein